MKKYSTYFMDYGVLHLEFDKHIILKVFVVVLSLKTEFYTQQYGLIILNQQILSDNLYSSVDS